MFWEKRTKIERTAMVFGIIGLLLWLVLVILLEDKSFWWIGFIYLLPPINHFLFADKIKRYPFKMTMLTLSFYMLFWGFGFLPIWMSIGSDISSLAEGYIALYGIIAVIVFFIGAVTPKR